MCIVILQVVSIYDFAELSTDVEWSIDELVSARQFNRRTP